MRLANQNEAVDFILNRVAGAVRLGTPLGLGKPNPLLNALYDRMKADPSRSLEIYTALSLDLPPVKGFFEERFYRTFLDRHFGANYPRLHYVMDLQNGTMPAHIHVHEFYLQAGFLKTIERAQRDYISLNYTHAGLGILDRGLNVIVQMISRGPDGRLSLSCNPDLTLDLKDHARERGLSLLIIGVVHPDLPFLGGDAIVKDSFFDAILEEAGPAHELFALPRLPIDPVSHLIGFHASQLVVDAGTLQIGIGSLAEALTAALLLRHQNNALFRELADRFWKNRETPGPLAADIFHEGLYGTSEMLMDGFMYLREAGILKRSVHDKGTGERHYLHAAFYLGSKDLYRWLRELKGDEFRGLAMTRVSKVNDLYDTDEMALRRQRVKARFFNTTMKMTALGGAMSETLDDGRVVSGVGGQFNFVAMAHELPDASSVLLMKSTRNERGRRSSNIVWEAGHLTIARHLRDVVVTEYGIAFLKGRSDEECIKALITITDAEFQDELVAAAKKSCKLAPDYRVPDWARRNTPAFVREWMRAARERAPQAFGPYPFGSDFTPEEERLVRALESLKHQGLPGILGTLLEGFRTSPKEFAPELARMQLKESGSMREHFAARLILGALKRS
jgi:acyl-CoA hydrolase